MLERTTEKQAGLIDRMMQVTDQLYIPHVERVFGSAGIAALRQLLGTVRSLYKYVPCEIFTECLTLGIPVTEDPSLDLAESAIADLSQLAGSQLKRAAMYIEKDGQVRVLADGRDLRDPLRSGIVYHYRYSQDASLRIEDLYIGGEQIQILNLSGFPSSFAVPTFADLDDALQHYSRIVDGPDPNLDVAWRDDSRLAFNPKPEKHMRRALEHFLRISLRDAIIRPEQNVNETEPVDIEVSWAYQGRIAWIEIKWLGYSGEATASAWSTTYSESRAVEGAKQLAGYMTSGSRRLLTIPCKGYLVVFDARRRGLRATDTAIDEDRGHHFRFRDVSYPEGIFDRTDMAPPRRFFLSPLIA